MKIKKILSAILTLGIIATCGFVGCDEGKETVQAPLPSADNYAVEQYDGQIIQSGGTYAFSSKMAFMSDTSVISSEMDFEPITASLRAIVSPSDANQAVDWAVEFVNPSSAWASGKTVTDYVSVSTESDGSTECTLTCKAAFGEQIKIVCRSQEDPSISAESTIDFLQSVTDVSLTFGDNLPINFGGQTDVTVEVNPNGVGLGGQANVNLILSDTYTIANEFSYSVNLYDPGDYFGDFTGSNYDSTYCKQYTDGYFVLSIGGIDYDCSVVDLFYRNGLTLDYTHFSGSNVIKYVDDDTVLDFNNLITSLSDNCTIKNGNLYTVNLAISSKKNGLMYEYKSLLNVTAFTNNARVKSIKIPYSEVNFSNREVKCNY